MTTDPIRVFCGADRSQQLAFLVLADSIRRNTRRGIDALWKRISYRLRYGSFSD